MLLRFANKQESKELLTLVSSNPAVFPIAAFAGNTETMTVRSFVALATSRHANTHSFVHCFWLSLSCTLAASTQY